METGSCENYINCMLINSVLVIMAEENEIILYSWHVNFEKETWLRFCLYVRTYICAY